MGSHEYGVAITPLGKYSDAFDSAGLAVLHAAYEAACCELRLQELIHPLAHGCDAPLIRFVTPPRFRREFGRLNLEDSSLAPY